MVYKATVTSGNSNDPQSQNIETYTGLTEPRAKKRFKKHYDDIKKFNPRDPENHKSGTRLSRHCGGLEASNIPYNIKWDILCETKVAFNPSTGYCKLCTTEKYFIMFNPDDASLNLRSEFFSHCRHKERHLLKK